MNVNTAPGVTVESCAIVRKGLDTHGHTYNNTLLWVSVYLCEHLTEKCLLSSSPAVFAESSEVVYVTHCSVL